MEDVQFFSCSGSSFHCEDKRLNGWETCDINIIKVVTVFQTTFKFTVLKKNFESSIAMVLSKKIGGNQAFFRGNQASI